MEKWLHNKYVEILIKSDIVRITSFYIVLYKQWKLIFSLGNKCELKTIILEAFL